MDLFCYIIISISDSFNFSQDAVQLSTASLTLFIPLQATDAGGEGHTTVVPVRVTLADSNDNPPKFSHMQYRAVIDEGAPDFDPQLVVTVGVSRSGVRCCSGLCTVDSEFSVFVS